MRNWVISLRKLNLIIFCSVFISKFFTDALFVANGQGGILVASKYFLLFMGIGLSAVMILMSGHGKLPSIFLKETSYIMQVVMLFVAISLVLTIWRGTVTTQTVVELGYILIAIVYAYCILNIFEFNDIMTCMKILLVTSIIAYIIEIGSGNFTIENLVDISFDDSRSAFESSYSASISMILCAFFVYYREDKKWTALAFIFCLATFKRLNVVFAVFFLLYPLLFDYDKRIDRRVITVMKILLVAGTIFFYYMYQVQNGALFQSIFGETATKFSTGRNLFLQRLLAGDYKSFGYGSSTAFLGYSIEMDFVKIYLELGIIGLIFFIWRYYDISGRNAFCFWFMTENMLNFLTSHSLASAFNWALRFLLIGCILYKQKNDLSYLRYKNKHKKKIRFRKLRS